MHNSGNRFIFCSLMYAVVSIVALCFCATAQILTLPENLRPDPFGGVVAADRTAGVTAGRSIVLEGARAAFVSCHIVAKLAQPGAYTVEVRPFTPTSGLQVELYREWFHFVPASKGYFPDALVPVNGVYRSTLPEPDNRIENQTAQGFWVDVWIPANATPGTYVTKAVLEAGGKKSEATIEVRVLNAVVPAEDAVAMDHNTYGTSWFATQYPSLSAKAGDKFFLSDQFFDLLHAYHRVFYEHRGLYHQLGYGHAGKVGPEFAPRLAGTGKDKHIADWTWFDRHYGPLLDGSAFTKTHLGAKPIPFVYLPINPEWPASQLWWGEPGYEREFVNVVSEMERHFREKGWTHTRFEMFFNHKKRYKGFEWDGDEARFANDFPYMHEYHRLLKQAIPADSPVQFVFRADVSWSIERQIKEFAGIINFWVCGGGEVVYRPEVVQLLRGRGDILFTYGGSPLVSEPSSHVTLDVLRQWIWGTNGFVRWLATDPGADPWFNFQGGGENMVYPGDRFGVAEPIASIRLKIQRNAVQDVTLLDELSKRKAIGDARNQAAKRFNGTELKDWWTPRPAFADKDPLELSNADSGEPLSLKFDKDLDAGAWQRVREYVLEMARVAQ